MRNTYSKLYVTTQEVRSHTTRYQYSVRLVQVRFIILVIHTTYGCCVRYYLRSRLHIRLVTPLGLANADSRVYFVIVLHVTALNSYLRKGVYHTCMTCIVGRAHRPYHVIR